MRVSVGVWVNVTVEVLVEVGVFVEVGVDVFVAVEVLVKVGVGGKNDPNTGVFVRVGEGRYRKRVGVCVGFGWKRRRRNGIRVGVGFTVNVAEADTNAIPADGPEDCLPL